MKPLRKMFGGPLVWVLLIVVAFLITLNIINSSTQYQKIPTSQMVSIINGDQKLRSVELTPGDQSVKITMADQAKTHYQSTYLDSQSTSLANRLNGRIDQGSLTVWRVIKSDTGIWVTIVTTVIPVLLMVVFFWFLMGSMQGAGGRGVLGFGKSKGRLAVRDVPETTFVDVAGCGEAVEELSEIREFLVEPGKFARVGAKVPKGVLLYGPPGTGKTLLARAVAGEAHVPFFSISGSDFVEMFVGVGASRVRDLFEQAKQSAPAIIFIDEIDAVGRHRGAGMGGGHDEREQTLNQLLVEMDGFDGHASVILIAATNRPDVLDPALLRPGRFDRQIPVEAPDVAGREQILRVHAKGKPMANNVNLGVVARRTPGFTGADLANVLNEAALLTARLNLATIGIGQLDEAIDRVIAGPAKKTRLMNEHERLTTAYHEGGHALVAAAMPGTDPVQKVTILPRGRALGYTMVMPDQDKYSQSRAELLDQMAYLMGGRAAEELVFHDPTTGASNDIEKATEVARAMVTQYGMSSRLGAVQLGAGDSEPFLGMGYQQSRDYSEHSAAIIDDEVTHLLETAHQEAYDTLATNRAVLDELVRQLFEKETLDKQQVAAIFTHLTPHPPRQPWTGSETRQPSNQPPVQPPKSSAAVESGFDSVNSPELPPSDQPGELPPAEPWRPPTDWQPPAWGGLD